MFFSAVSVALRFSLTCQFCIVTTGSVAEKCTKTYDDCWSDTHYYVLYVFSVVELTVLSALKAQLCYNIM